jgi:fused signal recognition particle receptor
MVLDATTGLNALVQAREFHSAVGLTGLILTKLDGTAKGGVVVAIAHDLKVPIAFVGFGEGLDDLQPFSPDAFTQALFVAS